MATLTEHDVIAEFQHVVNLRADELEAWLARPESKAVGDRQGGGESVGHRSGRRIVELLRRKRFDEDDLAHMRSVIGYVHRHLAQEPAHPEGSRWAASLKSWGHDPARS